MNIQYTRCAAQSAPPELFKHFLHLIITNWIRHTCLSILAVLTIAEFNFKLSGSTDKCIIHNERQHYEDIRVNLLPLKASV